MFQLPHFVAVYAPSLWKEPRNQIARSDLADCPVSSDISYPHDRDATCSPASFSVPGYDTTSGPSNIRPCERGQCACPGLRTVPLTHHAPIANQVRQPKLVILWLPRCRRRPPTDGMTWPRPRRSVKSPWSTPAGTLSHRPRQRHSRGLPTRHTSRHPSDSCRGLSPPCHRLKGPRTHLLPCGRDVAGTWLHSPILPTCISVFLRNQSFRQSARNNGLTFPLFRLFQVQNGPRLPFLQLTQIPVHG